jgi:uncharacterized protein YqgV (UPF0045/DUF77 family)
MTVIAEIQVAPSPPGTDENPHAHVEAAIAVIQASGLRYEVGALGTTLEGDADQVWTTLRAAHEAMLAAGATGGISHIKVASVNRTIESLTSKFPLTRPGLPAVVTHADPSHHRVPATSRRLFSMGISIHASSWDVMGSRTVRPSASVRWRSQGKCEVGGSTARSASVHLSLVVVASVLWGWVATTSLG